MKHMGKLEIINHPDSFHLDVKRFYVPGLEFKASCPKCNCVVSKDMAREYFHYPSTNTPMEIRMYCTECEDDWSAGYVSLKVTAEVVEQ